MSKMKSFARAEFDGDIVGPNWRVVDSETGEPLDPGNQDYGHTKLGRAVRTVSGSYISTVVDYQHPADTPLVERSPEVEYPSFTTRRAKL